MPDRPRQAGELLQRAERLRPRRLPAAEPNWTIYGELVRAFLANLEAKRVKGEWTEDGQGGR